MEIKDLKYLVAYLIPASGFIAIALAGVWSFTSVILAFVFIPIIEQLIPVRTENLDSESEANKKHDQIFRYLLYVNIPLVFGLMFFLLHRVSTETFQPYEWIGMIWSAGIVLATSGINVAHELGHKTSSFDQFLSKLLLLPSLYIHFFIEHNRGHHKHVATPLDPASSRRGENLYAFWLRSIVGGYKHAWEIERSRLKQSQKPFWSFHNQMILFQIIQLAYLVAIWLIFGTIALIVAIVVGVMSFCFLETINYIEHYGLTRKLLPNGRYEKVQVTHSWNSDHILGRIILYELVRHSDHHYKASKDYQILRHYDESPQLPFGYPGSMILSIFPPLWFKVMDKELQKWNG